ncbi:restriction endonuclease subunit S [Staphylococcus pseudoxylosus]|uniref:restriction endonuclease subunit S n=1 Tax=Staphylococcus shinii TaxID=2912228 RepID=UPI001EE38F68
MHSTPTYDSNGDIYFINGNNLVNGRIDFKTSKKISVQEFNKYKNYLEAKNTLLLSINGTIGNIAKYEGENILLGKSAAYINVVSKFISRCYIFYYLQTSKIYESFLRELTGTTIKNLSLKSIKNIIVYISELDEQQKIGNFFSKLDRQIELEEQKLAKLEEQKKGYMQQIFSQQLRFKDENGNDYPEWKKKKLDDVANYRRGSFPQPYGNKEWYDEKNGEPFVQVVDVDKNMKLHDKTKQKISDLAKPKSVKGFKGDIVVTLQGSIGRVALLHYDAYIDRTLLLIDSFKIEMNKNYFKYVLYLLFLKEKERAPGGTIKTITKKVLSNFKIDIPNVGEQEKIGSFFKNLDEFIEKQANKVELLKQRKQSFLQKMFV